MAEHIEREVAIKAVEEVVTAMESWITDYQVQRHGLMTAITILDDVPAADVVPVTRCKDCKFWDRERISVEGLARCQTGETGIRYRKATDFCSRGERMDGAS